MLVVDMPVEMCFRAEALVTLRTLVRSFVVTFVMTVGHSKHTDMKWTGGSLREVILQLMHLVKLASTNLTRE